MLAADLPVTLELNFRVLVQVELEDPEESPGLTLRLSLLSLLPLPASLSLRKKSDPQFITLIQPRGSLICH